MSLDLYQNEAVNRLSSLQPVQSPEAGAFEGLAKGTGMYAMRSLAVTARAVDLAGSVGPIIQDAITGGTVAQDRYFKEHDEIFSRAVDYWTPRPNEVGIAGQVVGTLLGTLPQVLISPALAVGSAQLGTAEDLVKDGVSSGAAQAVGAVQGAGMGLGVWMPILGKTGWQRIAIGGAGFNTVQGMATRGISGAFLDGTPAADQFKAFDPTQVTLDVLLGAAFGTMAHVSPAQRAQGAKAWEAIGEWGQALRPSDRDALATLRVAQHLNVDSAPGILDTHEAIDAHTTRMRTAVDQLLRDEPVELSNLPYPRTTPDEARIADMFTRADSLRAEGDSVSRTLGLPRPNPTEAELATIARDRLVAHVEPELLARAGAGDIAQIDALKTAVADLDQRIRSAEAGRDAAVRETTQQHQDTGKMKFKAAQALANKDVDAQISDLHATRERQANQLESARSAETARQDLDVFARGEVPERYQSALDAFLGKAEQSFKKSPIADMVHAALDDMAGTTEQPPAKAGARTEAQPAKAASPLPPPGASEPAGASAKPNLLAQEAQRMVAARPDERITIGRNPDGSPIITTAAKYLADVQQDVAAAREQAKLFEVAAGCYLARS